MVNLYLCFHFIWYTTQQIIKVWNSIEASNRRYEQYIYDTIIHVESIKSIFITIGQWTSEIELVLSKFYVNFLLSELGLWGLSKISYLRSTKRQDNKVVCI